MENHGTVCRTRWRLLRERIEAMKLIWTEEEAEYHGEFVDFGPIWCYPKPVQKPWPPIFLGGHTPAARQHVVESYDGWMPTIMRTADFLTGIEDVRRMAREYGRDPRSISISMIFPRADRKVMDRYAAAGVDRVMLGLPSADGAAVLRKLDDHAKLAGL